MGVSSEGDQSVQEKLKEVCSSLNMDRQSASDALQAFDAISKNYTLEGDCRHWLACALYVACRIGTMPTVATASTIQGNFVSLRSLLQTCDLDLLEFFRKMEKWSDMANLDHHMRRRVNSLRQSFNVSTIVYSKLDRVFHQLFQGFEPEKHLNRGKRYRGPTTSADLYKLSWLLYISLKSRINTETVSCFHLLLCCLDFIYVSALHGDRADLFNQDFYQEQVGRCQADNVDLRDVGVLRSLCDGHKAVFSEANVLRIYYLHNPVKELIINGTFKGTTDPLALSMDYKDVEATIKALKQSYELSVLRAGELDEQILLAEDACQQIGIDPTSESDAHDMLCKQLAEHMKRQGSVGVQTPLTGRNHLNNREHAINLSPVSTATQGASKLHCLLAGRNHMPSDALNAIFSQIVPNPAEQIDATVREMGRTFCAAYAQRDGDAEPVEGRMNFFDFAKKRLQLGEALFYKILEAIITLEQNPLKPLNDFSVSLRQEQFQRSLFASCLEIVMLSYNSQETLFPWGLGVFQLKGYHFYRIIEPFIRAEQQLSREVVKHFNRIEEQILESIAWKSDSPVWELLATKKVPAAQQVLLPNQLQPTVDTRNVPIRQLLMTTNGTIMEVMTPQVPSQEIEVQEVKGSWGLFFRKVYYLAFVRLKHLCSGLHIPDEHLTKVWTVVEHALMNETQLMKDRHLDQIIMSCVYALCKLSNIDKTFHDITQCYRSQPNSQNHVYRSVLITNLDETSPTGGRSEDSNSEAPASLPTPGGLAGTSTLYADGQRGDIIKFYNSVFVPRVRPFLIRFRPGENQTPNPLMSPLPRVHNSLASPKPLKVTNDCKIFVSPYKANTLPMNFAAKTFRIQQSPAKDLADINKMVQIKGETILGSKRALDMDTANGDMPKRIHRKLQSMFNERQPPQ